MALQNEVIFLPFWRGDLYDATKLETLNFSPCSYYSFNGIWESHVQPTDWQFSLMQPIYKGHDKDKTDPASYRGISFNQTL